MTQQEFFERTKVEVSNDEFLAINEVYNYSDLDKDDFCKMWCKMNQTRVKVAKAEMKARQEERANTEVLRKWFDRYHGTQYFFNNYHTYIAYTKLSAKEVHAMSYAYIRIEDNSTLSDIHFKVGQYLGVYNR